MFILRGRSAKKCLLRLLWSDLKNPLVESLIRSFFELTLNVYAQDYITSGSASGDQSPVWDEGRGRLMRLRTVPEEEATGLHASLSTSPASPLCTNHSAWLESNVSNCMSSISIDNIKHESKSDVGLLQNSSRSSGLCKNQADGEWFLYFKL